MDTHDQKPLKIRYLILYNFINAVLWLAILGRVVLLVPLVGFKTVYGGVGDFAKWTQTLAALEVVHVTLGLVRSSIPTTIMQIASRFLLVWGVVNLFPHDTGVSPMYTSMLVAWSITEVIRYSYFVMLLQGSVPDVLSWLRYNTFYVLYPLGICSEVWLIYRALEPAKRWNPYYEYYLKAIMPIYAPGSYILYTHMMSQRRKAILGKAPKRS